MSLLCWNTAGASSWWPAGSSAPNVQRALEMPSGEPATYRTHRANRASSIALVMQA